jgi:hypothetical protein
MNGELPDGAILYMNDNRGQYIPMDFARETIRECISGVKSEDLDALAKGPPGSMRAEEGGCEAYWEIWDEVCSRATVTSPESGTVYTLHQDGDLWLIPKDSVWPDAEV